MANSNGWGDGAANNSIGWGQGANNAIAWGDSHARSWAGATDIVGIDSDAQAFITAAAITNPVQINAINALVKDMKADGVWTKMKAIYPFVGGTASAHKWNLKDPRDLDAAFRLVFNGGWTHSANGATPNGTNGYADTKFNPSNVSSVAYNDFSMGVYLRSQVGGTDAQMGYFSGFNDTLLLSNFNSTSVLYRLFTNTDNTSANSANVSKGLTSISTLAASTAKVYKQGSLIYTGNNTSTTKGNLNIYIGGLNGLALWSSAQFALSYISQGLTDTEAANLYTRVQAFQTALSRQV